MMDLNSALGICLLGTVQVVGLVSACLARLSERSTRQTPFQFIFLLLLGLVGLATAWAATWGPGAFCLCGTTLAIMSITVTWDPRAGRSALAR